MRTEGYNQAGRPALLDEHALLLASEELAARDARLAAILHAYGPPPLWAREPGFATLLWIILEQQVSMASARAAFDKLCLIASPLTPERFLSLDDAALRAVGFSRQKARYGRALAAAVQSGALDLDLLAAQDDDAVRAELVRLPGIGRWTADVYLLMVLLRPDVWPHGDLGLAVGAAEVLGLSVTPSYPELAVLAEAWHPWRAVAARLIWHAYLSKRGK
jgi:DNA-3-methyladenine glycosylase II